MSLRGAALSYSRSSSESANIAIGSSRLDFFKRYACNVDGGEGEGEEMGGGEGGEKGRERVKKVEGDGGREGKEASVVNNHAVSD
jgi:hypothetical protein